MEPSTKKDCVREGQAYSHGSEFCDLTKSCMRCNDGEWEISFEEPLLTLRAL